MTDLEADGRSKNKMNFVHQYSKVGRRVCQPVSAVLLITTLSNQDHRGVTHPTNKILPDTQNPSSNQRPLFARRQDKLVDREHGCAHICLGRHVLLVMFLKPAGYFNGK